MAAEVKSYQLAPNWDFPPAGPLKLGTILYDVKKPHRALNLGKESAVPASSLYAPAPITNWSRKAEDLRNGSIGVFASFLQIVGIGGDVEYTRGSGRSKTYKVEKMETQWFRPDAEFIKASMRNDQVINYVQDGWFKQPVFMITGIKIARGASMESVVSKNHSTEGKVGVDLTAAGAPVQVGPKGKLEVKDTETVKIEKLPDCLFAYQVVKIKAKGKDSYKDADYNRHAVMDDGSDETQKDSGPEWETEEYCGDDGAVVMKDEDDVQVVQPKAP